MTQIYQDHDTSYQLKVIGDKIREMKQEKNKKRGQVLEIGKILLKVIWTCFKKL